MSLEGKVAVVTGGGSGIGEGIVMCMAREGADVAIPDIQEGNAQHALYDMLRENDGWRINGLVTRPDPGLV